ncbi:2-hydroxymuconate tautomerase [Desulfosporosinus sp. FKB]|uniref:2-hydroxymuconate tautomerase n=1 Tax=Desulfosporosinus sp. FKB TaxID=1969835 RepID=UPI000B4A1B79|nr:2-hydroxymuconate tautomerase [Desulfosporosinus sp. FKB]
MPFVNVQMLAGRTVEQKAALAKAITEAFVKITNSQPEAVSVIFNDIQKTDLAKAGKLVSES